MVMLKYTVHKYCSCNAVGLELNCCIPRWTTIKHWILISQVNGITATLGSSMIKRLFHVFIPW